jgi:hypothetical protein
MMDRFHPRDFHRAAADVEFCIEGTSEYSVAAPPEAREFPEQQFYTVVKALRLLAAGYVEMSGSYSSPLRPGILPERGQATRLSLWARHYASRTYHLPDSAVPTLPHLTKVLSGELPRKLAIVVSRLDAASERERLEDSFLDHVIVMDALFGDNADRLPGGLTYKLSIRAAGFLGDDLGGRRAVFQTMQNAIGIRSKIVHGGSNLRNLGTADEATIAAVGNLARTTVQKMLLPRPRTLDGNFFDDILLT